MPQNYEDQLDLSLTPVEYLNTTGDKEEMTRIRTYLGALKYTADEMDHPIRELSGGQKAKVLLLKMSLSNANVLILDEPTRNFRHCLVLSSVRCLPHFRGRSSAFPMTEIYHGGVREGVSPRNTRVSGNELAKRRINPENSANKENKQKTKR